MVEFALLALPLMAILVGFFKMGRFFFLNEALANAAREGARAAAVRGAASPVPATQADIRAIVRAHVPGLIRPDSVAVDTVYEPDNSPGGQVRVVVTYSYRLIVPWIGEMTTVSIDKRSSLTISR
ncbi:MAG: TadE/TadG family type IV pilus assembly protein [Alphaproteobacteria bacterium]